MGIENLKDELREMKKQCKNQKNNEAMRYCDGCIKSRECGFLCGLDGPGLFLEFIKSAEIMGLI